MRGVEDALTKQELEAEHCWEGEDRVPGRPNVTAFRQRLRLHQSRWRESKGYPIGSQPMVPKQGGPKPRPVGSRLPVDFARETGANFITPNALQAVRTRTAITEREQSFDHQRVWAELLWSPALCFNLFGDLAADIALADRAVHTWWPDTPGTVTEVRFAHSPGRLDPTYLENLVDFNVAFVLDLRDGTKGIMAVATKYHDRYRRQPPKPKRLPRYIDVTKKSGVFHMDALPAVNGTDLIHLWLEHMLVHSMLQHPSGEWTWGRFALVHPAGNDEFVDAASRYRSTLVDESNFATLTIEDLLDSDVLPKKTVSALRARYIPR